MLTKVMKALENYRENLKTTCYLQKNVHTSRQHLQMVLEVVIQYPNLREAGKANVKWNQSWQDTDFLDYN